jgi:2-phospho-L-lactate guanylyltransferase (CobY/MobA/RfbA family)
LSNWTVVIPVKGTASAKSRLGASPELALAIALDTVAAVGPRVIVVTSPSIATNFEALGARIVIDPEQGLTTALRAADHRPAFGVHSRAAHLAAGYVELDIPLDSGLRRDVDTAAHLAALAPRVGTHTRALL